MNTKRLNIAICFLAMSLLILGCGLGQLSPQTGTPTPTLTPTPTPKNSPTPTPTPTDTPTPTATRGTPEETSVSYLVKQIETLGGEVISGSVCSLTKPFSVNSVTPKVAFVFVFVPIDAQHGNMMYTYSIPSAGESHDAKGTYTISPASPDGTLLLSLAGSDHVVFKGFDGNIPIHYKFDLVPSTTVTCP
jgi:hypothetical protein